MAAVVVQVVSMVVMILEKEEGAVMQEGGVPSLSLQSRLIDLPTTLPFKMTFKKKNVTLPV